MRWQVGPDLTDFLRAYAKRLRNWFREAIANLRGSFQAVAAIYRVDLEPPEIETSEEHTRIAADLDQLKKWAVSQLLLIRLFQLFASDGQYIVSVVDDEPILGPLLKQPDKHKLPILGRTLWPGLCARSVVSSGLFILDWISDPALRRRSNAGLNKGEARNALARALFFHRHGEIRDRTFENQRYRASGLNRTIAAITLWNTVYLSRAVAELRAQGEILPDTLLAHIGPLGWEHISFMVTTSGRLDR